MGSFQQKTLIPVLRHDLGRRTLPNVRTAVVCVWTPTAGDPESDDGLPILKSCRFYIRKCDRFNSSDFVSYILKRCCGDLLARDLTSIGHAEQHKPAAAV